MIQYKNPVKKINKAALIHNLLLILITLILIPIAESAINATTIDLSSQYDSKILSSNIDGKIGHLGGTVVGDINGDGFNDLIVSSYNESVIRQSFIDQPFDKDSWTESGNLSLWHSHNGIQTIATSSDRVSGNKSIAGSRSNSEPGTMYIVWNEGLNLTGVQSLNMFINVSGRNETLTDVTIYSDNIKSLVYDTNISLKKNWTEIIINFTDFKQVDDHTFNSSNVTSVTFSFSGGYKSDNIKLDNLHFVINQTISSIGAVYVFYGPVNGTYNTSDANVKIIGTKDSVDFGEYITVGDINKDAYNDIIIGSPLTANEDGKVQVFFGGPHLGAVIFEDNYSIYGKQGSKLGNSITAKDINNDGMDDLVIGAPSVDDKGEIYVIYGSGELHGSMDLNYLNPDITIAGQEKSKNIGNQSSFDVGDVNGDGQKDLIIGSELGDGETNTKKTAGEVYIIKNISSKSGMIKLNLRNISTVIFGTDPGDHLGGHLIVRDINRDGLDDMLIGAGGADGINNNRNNTGEVYLIYGRRNLTNSIYMNLSKADVRIIGADPDDLLGTAIGAGNGSSILIGSRRGDGLYDNKSDCGDIYVLSNLTQRLIDLNFSHPDYTIYGPEKNDWLRDLYIGDVSGDDIPDFIIGFREATGPLYRKTGNVFVVYGKNAGN